MKVPRLADGVQVPPPTSIRLPDGSTRMTQTGNVKSLFPVMNSFGGLQMIDETGLDGIYTLGSEPSSYYSRHDVSRRRARILQGHDRGCRSEVGNTQSSEGDDRRRSLGKDADRELIPTSVTERARF